MWCARVVCTPAKVYIHGFDDAEDVKTGGACSFEPVQPMVLHEWTRLQATCSK